MAAQQSVLQSALQSAHQSAMSSTSSAQRAGAILRDTFGYQSYQPFQQEIIQTLLDGGHAMAIMPTGGGKSLCYQIPSMVRAGTGVVVSPLIALMKDQVDALLQYGVRAACWNSSLSYADKSRVEEQLLGRELDLLYVAPEGLLAGPMLEMLSRITIALFAIDEAHCVSRWGHDFRPEYIQLSILARRFPEVPRIALTATADEVTQTDIVEQLALGDAAKYIASLDRPNIRYLISQAAGGRQALLDFITAHHPGEAGIVYCLSRRNVDDTSQWLCGKGLRAVPYHAGLSATVRARNQNQFSREDGVVAVATVAFGMGIDKPDVRFVAHLNLPKNIEAYYQETGRAGRDRQPASAWMRYAFQDVVMLMQMVNNSEAAEDFKRNERRKMNALLGFCESTACRRQIMFAYFDEQYQAPCGNCDNCLNPPQTWDGSIAAQKALSCVYRTGQRFGVAHLTDVLLGKDSEKIRRFGHQKLSVYGIGGEHKAAQWHAIFRHLTAAGHLSPGEHGSLQFTATSRAVLKKEIAVWLRKLRPATSRKKTAAARPVAALTSGEEKLFAHLSALRAALAKKQNVPSYVIFLNTTLADMAVKKPQNEAELSTISGVGGVKIEKYAAPFLHAIQQFETENHPI